jgi:hypothetical protein
LKSGSKGEKMSILKQGNRFLGLKWLAATLYPDAYKVDMVKEVKDFIRSSIMLTYQMMIPRTY